MKHLQQSVTILNSIAPTSTAYITYTRLGATQLNTQTESDKSDRDQTCNPSDNHFCTGTVWYNLNMFCTTTTISSITQECFCFQNSYDLLCSIVFVFVSVQHIKCCSEEGRLCLHCTGYPWETPGVENHNCMSKAVRRITAVPLWAVLRSTLLQEVTVFCLLKTCTCVMKQHPLHTSF